MRVNKTTTEHFEIFKNECNRWLDFFGMKDWEVRYEHEKEEGSLACYTYNFHNRLVTMIFSTVWRDDVNEKAIKKVAFHEACEVFLLRVRYLGEARFIDGGEIDEAIHAVVRTLENVIFESEYNKR